MRTIIFNTMDLERKISELNNEVSEQCLIKQKAHVRIIELKSQIKKLTTLAKHAEEVFGESKVTVLPEHLEN